MFKSEKNIEIIFWDNCLSRIKFIVRFNSKTNNFYYKDNNMNYFKRLNILNLKDCYFLHTSIVDKIVYETKYIKSKNEYKITYCDRLTNNIFSFIISRFNNFIDYGYKSNNWKEVFIINNYVDIKQSTKKYFQYKKDKYNKYYYKINTY